MRRKEDIKIKEIAGERVAIRQGSHGQDMTKIIAFNPVAEWLWNQLEGKNFTKEDVMDLLMGTYKIEQSTAEGDAERWINQCIEADIIEV
ncbi:MAG: PqqD family protein [Prevotella sp.]|jgi:hypothetical protein|nr:PqqD family protein [Prevotella sp.]